MSAYERMDDKNKREKLANTGKEITAAQQSSLRNVHIAFVVLCLLSSIGAFITVGVSPETWTMRLLTSTDYRDSATIDTDFYPEFTFDISRTIDLGLVAASISLAAALGHVIGWVWIKDQAKQMMGGSNPYVWASFFLWHPIVFLLVSVLAGIGNVFTLSFLCLAVISWIFLLWVADLANSYAVSFLLYKSGVAMWSWLPTLFVWFVAVATYIMIIIYSVQTFGAAAFAAAGVQSGWYIALVAIHLGLYLANPIIFVAWKAEWIESIYTREMIYYIFNGIFAIVATWLTIGLFKADSVTLP